MREWFIFFLLVSFFSGGSIFLTESNFRPELETSSVTADNVLTVPNGSTGTGGGD
ncbi:MAG: hypothetical protein ABR517_02460 [Thermoanaerobaculia bacterium]